MRQSGWSMIGERECEWRLGADRAVQAQATAVLLLTAATLNPWQRSCWRLAASDALLVAGGWRPPAGVACFIGC